MINDKIIRREPICMKPSWVSSEEEGGKEGDEENISQRYRSNCSVITSIISRQLDCYYTAQSVSQYNTQMFILLQLA